MTTATSPTPASHIPMGHASFWETACWWIEQTMTVYGEPAEFVGQFERREVVDRLRGWLSEIECLVRRLVIAAALALDLPPPAPPKPREKTSEAKPAAPTPAGPDQPDPEKPDPEKPKPPPRLTFLPSPRDAGNRFARTGRPKAYDWEAAYARFLSAPSDPLKDKGDHSDGMIDFRADLTDTLDRRQCDPDDGCATRSRTRFDIASYALHLRDGQLRSALVSMEKCGRKLEALLHVLADPARAILSTARRLGARSDAAGSFPDRFTRGEKPKTLKDSLRDTTGLVADAQHARASRHSGPAQPAPYEEPG